MAWGSLLSGTTTTDGLNGSVDSDWIEGFDGHDHLVGMAGNDVLVGGRGNDTLSGGLGNDLYSIAKGGWRTLIIEFDPTPGKCDEVFCSDLSTNDLRTVERFGNQLNLRFAAGDRLHPQPIHLNRLPHRRLPLRRWHPLG